MQTLSDPYPRGINSSRICPILIMSYVICPRTRLARNLPDLLSTNILSSVNIY